jgi:hypothetical protein
MTALEREAMDAADAAAAGEINNLDRNFFYSRPFFCSHAS